MEPNAGALVKLARLLVGVSVRGAMRLVYRIRVHGVEHLPAGGALLIANHLSHADALWIGGAIQRPVIFLMHRSFFQVPIVGWFARLFGTIPVASEDSAEEKQRSLARAAAYARSGALVCIFPEGAISRSGQMLGFRRGLESMAREAQVPIVPVVLDRVWGSIFSYEGGRFFFKFPRRWPYPLELAIGPALSTETDAWQAREALSVLLVRTRERYYRQALPLAARLRRAGCTGERWQPFLAETIVHDSIRHAPWALTAGAQALARLYGLDSKHKVWLATQAWPQVTLAVALSGASPLWGSEMPAAADVWFLDLEQARSLCAAAVKPRLAVCITRERDPDLAQRWPQLRFACPAVELGGILTAEVDSVGQQVGERARSLGRAVPGTALSIRVAADGPACEPLVRGRVCVQSPALMLGRLGEPDLDRESWLDLGFEACLDREGFLFLD